jgi:uncharacterized protein (DUF427 family)
MATAAWNNQSNHPSTPSWWIVIADTDTYEEVEGNVYFPIASVRQEFLQPSELHSVCFWKGEASYYNVVVNDQVNKNAAWYYADPSFLARKIKDHVAFWRGVTVAKKA